VWREVASCLAMTCIFYPPRVSPRSFGFIIRKQMVWDLQSHSRKFQIPKITLKPLPALHPKTMTVQYLYHDVFFIWQLTPPSRTLHRPEKIRSKFFEILLCVPPRRGGELHAVISIRTPVPHACPWAFFLTTIYYPSKQKTRSKRAENAQKRAKNAQPENPKQLATS
jgi:hypothetical protein